MKLLIVCSEVRDSRNKPGPFERSFDGLWAQRFIKHLRNDRNLCTGCGDRCVHCRDWRVYDFSSEIVEIIRLPAILAELLDNSSDFFPEKLPLHDVLLAIEIHEEILIELPRKAADAGGKAIIVPIEAPDWLSRWSKGKLIKEGKKYNIEIAVPKPFCALQFGIGPTVDRFINHFRLGYPAITIEQMDGRIAKAFAEISAPCGNSHYVAHSLQGYPISDELEYAVSKYWHSSPCTASMKSDPELGGDTILHRGGQIHMESFCKAAGKDG